MIRALLVDDEPRAVERLADLLGEFPDVEVIGTARDVGDAERFLAGRTPDVVFLDIDMPGRTGFDLVPSVPATSRLVFVTAHDDRALDAFHVGAVDYLRKPVDRDRLAVTIDRLLGRPDPARPDPTRLTAGAATPDADDDEALEASGDTADSVTLAHHGGRTVETVPLVEILWVEAFRNYSRVRMTSRSPLLVRRTMSEWAALLPAPPFGRIDRSLIINLAAIQSTQWQSRYQTLIFFRGVAEALPVGRTATARLKGLLPR